MLRRRRNESTARTSLSRILSRVSGKNGTEHCQTKRRLMDTNVTILTVLEKISNVKGIRTEGNLPVLPYLIGYILK